MSCRPNRLTVLFLALSAPGCVSATPEAPATLGSRQGQKVATSEKEPPPPAPRRTELALDDGTIASLRLVEGMAPQRRPSRRGFEFEVSGTQVSLFESPLAPDSADEFRATRGERVRKSEQDGEHSAFVLATRTGEGEDVYGFAPGLLCYATEVPAETVDMVFDVCSSMRRVGGVLTYARLPEVEETQIFGQPALDIEAGQFGGSRILEGEGDLDCDGLLTAVDYGRHASQVETLTLAHGDVRVWWSVDDEGDKHGQSKVFATRGNYCCGFELRPWFEPASRSDLGALAHVCDNAAQPDWPNAYLPPPRLLAK